MNNQDIINDVRNKIDIVDLISEYLPLVQKGKNYFGVCPFHNDTNPSMSVSREKQIYKCFSCGASGNIFTFVSEYENISFKDALEKLAERVGYKLSSSKSYNKPNVNEKYYDMYELALKFYKNNINASVAKEAKEYLKNRSIDSDIIKDFEIGFSLDKSTTLMELLTKKGYSYRDMVDLGLAVDNHDMYINRIMFPLYDPNGRVVGFSGRVYGDSKKNKYVNTKETPIFKKGHCLYNYHIAKEECRKKGYVIVMEGFMDVIRASTIGFKNVVAVMGTALTTEQQILLKKLSFNVILCFDGDDAGAHATLSIGNDLEKIGIMPKVIALNNDDDPDTYILKYGKESFESLIENAINFSDYKINNLKKGVNFKSDIELANYIDSVLKETSKIKDDIRREIILKKLAIDYNLGYNTLEKRLTEYSESAKTSNIQVKKEIKPSHLTRYQKSVYALIYNMLINSNVIELLKKETVYFIDTNSRYLANEVMYYYDKYGNVSIADMYTYLADKEELLALLKEIDSFEDYDSSDAAVFDYIYVIKEYNKKQEIKRLSDLMKNEIDLHEKIKLAEKIRLIKIGENSNG